MRKTHPLLGTSRRSLLLGIALSPTMPANGATANEAKKAYAGNLLDISHDGRYLAIVYQGEPYSFFRSGARSWFRIPASKKTIDLMVIEMGTWQVLYHLELPRMDALSGSFVSAPNQVYVQWLQNQQYCREIITLNGRGYKSTATLCSSTKETMVFMQALGEGRFVADEPTKAHRLESMAIYHEPNWALEKRVYRELAPEDQWKLAYMISPRLSLNREFAVEGVAGEIHLRRTSDLSVIWKAKPNPGWTLGELGLSADSSFVAALVTTRATRAVPSVSNVMVLSGKDGATITQFFVQGAARVAISPNGEMAAVAEIQYHDEQLNDVQLNVRIYQVGSGRLQQTIQQDRVMARRGSGILPGFSLLHGLTFSVDGRYIIVSALDVKVWAIDPS